MTNNPYSQSRFVREDTPDQERHNEEETPVELQDEPTGTSAAECLRQRFYDLNPRRKGTSSYYDDDRA